MNDFVYRARGIRQLVKGYTMMRNTRCGNA